MTALPWMTPPIIAGRRIDPTTGIPLPEDPGIDPTMGMPAPSGGGGLLGRLSGALGGSQGLLNLGANLMAASGPSEHPVSFGQALGSSILANQQFQRQRGQDMLEAMLLKTKLKTAEKDSQPSDVQSYEYAKANGFTGSFADWKRVAASQPQGTSDIQNWEYFNKLSPEDKKTWMSLQRQPTAPQLSIINGVPTLVDRIQGTQTPLTTQEAEIGAAKAKAEAEARAKARGTVVGEAEGGIEKKGVAAENVNAILDVAEPLIDLSTGSKIGAGADKVAAMFGKSLDGAQAAAQLQILQAGLMFAQPRMEGPQGVLDVQLYEKAAGQIGDPTVPAATKKAAIKTIRALQSKYKEAADRLDGAKPSAETKVRKFNPQTGKIE